MKGNTYRDNSAPYRTSGEGVEYWQYTYKRSKGFLGLGVVFYTRSFISAELRGIIKPVFYFSTLLTLLPLMIINCYPMFHRLKRILKKSLYILKKSGLKKLTETGFTGIYRIKTW